MIRADGVARGRGSCEQNFCTPFHGANQRCDRSGTEELSGRTLKGENFPGELLCVFFNGFDARELFKITV